MVWTVCVLPSGAVYLHSDALEVIRELTKEKKGCLRVVTVPFRLQVLRARMALSARLL